MSQPQAWDLVILVCMSLLIHLCLNTSSTLLKRFGHRGNSLPNHGEGESRELLG